MSPTKPIALILGSGPGVGSAVASRYLKDGYQVATVSRRAPAPAATTDEGELQINGDLSDHKIFPSVFQRVEDTFGGAPSVVVWNAASLTRPTDENQKDMFTIDTEKFRGDMDVMITSPFAAAREAVTRWTAGTSGNEKKAFIYTGNILPFEAFAVPMVTTLGAGKSGALYWLKTADMMYKEQGIRFIFADQRHDDGSPRWKGTGPAGHAEMYSRIAKAPEAFPNIVLFGEDGTKHIDF